MPYVSEENRKLLDNSISTMVLALKRTIDDGNIFGRDPLSNEEVLKILGNINYCFSRVTSNLMGEVSYSKVAMITGVLENIKQEYYRRIAENYEDLKIKENGDIPEYERYNRESK
jgi:hypothetical protein